MDEIARTAPDAAALAEARGARTVTLASTLALLALAGCSAPPPAGTRFEATGELIALSGGDAGARGACIICHGLNGEGDGVLAPRIAGLSSGYIVRQLENYAEGQRRHPQMSWIAKHLDNDDRIKLGNYYAAMDWAPMDGEGSHPPSSDDASCTDPAIAALYHRGDPSRGLPSCASCHGDDGLGDGTGNPPLAGQAAPYMAEQLRRWRKGERYGGGGRVMHQVSLRLREHEIGPVADYSASLQGGNNRPALQEECPPVHRGDSRSGA